MKKKIRPEAKMQVLLKCSFSFAKRIKRMGATLLPLFLAASVQAVCVSGTGFGTKQGGRDKALSAKSVSILGDSYSTFEGYLTPDTNSIFYFARPDTAITDVASATQTWWYMFIKENGYRLCVNNSFSGATISFHGYSHRDYSDRSFVTRLTNLGCPDIIFVFGATNDCWAGSPIGNFKYADWSRQDLGTFRPAMACMLHRLLERYVNTEIYFILNDGLSKEITSSCKEICAHYGVKCIALSGIDKKSGHPTIKGMRQITDQIERALK